jgi:hypothetical protein
VIVEHFEQVVDIAPAERGAASPFVAVVIVAASVAVFVFIVLIAVATPVTAPPTVFPALFLMPTVPLTMAVFLALVLPGFSTVPTKFPSAALVDPGIPRILNLVAADWTRVRVHFALLFADFVWIRKTPAIELDVFTRQSSENHLQLMPAQSVPTSPVSVIVIIVTIIIVTVTMAPK